MHRVPKPSSASERAHWLAELAQALEQAQRLAWRLDAEAGPEAMELYSRLEAARMEVRSLQLGRLKVAPDDHDPKWASFLPWSRAPERR